MASERTRTKRQPDQITQVFLGNIQSLGIGNRYAGWLIVEHWKEIVGDAIAQRATAVHYGEGTLTVAVPDASWRQELLTQRETLLAHIHAHPGGQAVSTIRFVHGWKGNDTEYDAKSR